MISAKILAHSVNASNGIELFTFELTFPRIILAEVNTYRMLSRNAASSRAIPAKKMRERVKANPFEFVFWGKNQSGMSAAEELDPELKKKAQNHWEAALSSMLYFHECLEGIGLHKQNLNRLLEPWMYTTIVATGNEDAWLHLMFERDHPDAQPEFRVLAQKIKEAYIESSHPRILCEGQWHLPYVTFDDEVSIDKELEEEYKEHGDFWAMISSARCARVSYLTQDGKRDLREDLALFRRLIIRTDNPQDPIHASPLEHACMAVAGNGYIGNIKGYRQYRKFFSNENTLAVIENKKRDF